MSRRTRRKIREALALAGSCLKSRHLRRTACMLLCFVMCLQAFPAGAFAAKYDDVLNDFSLPVDKGRAATNTYILEISNGTQQGGGAAENVLYFTVFYTDVNGTGRSVIIMPNVDGRSLSMSEAFSAGFRSDRGNIVSEIFGYKEGLSDSDIGKALSSVKTDQLIFETPVAVDRIDKIQIFGKVTAAKSEWSCQAMRIYRADVIYGLDYYGWYSDDLYIDYSGECIAEVMFSVGSGIFHWNTSGGAFTISRPVSGRAAAAVLITPADKSEYESAYRKTTHVGESKGSQAEKQIVFRMDFADRANAGFESLAVLYENGSEPSLSMQELCECAALKIRYLDVYGAYRDVILPFVINSLGPVVQLMGDFSIAGYAQQGDSVAIPAMLPDFADIGSVSMIIGERAVLAATKLEVNSSAAGRELRSRRSAMTENDSISYTCLAVYRDVDMDVELEDNGATLLYSFEPGDGEPFKYSTATSVDGITLSPGSEKTFTFNSYISDPVLKPNDRVDRYLVTITTDNVANAGTDGDLSIQFRYTSIKDKELRSPVYNVREYVKAFYGDWPANTDDFAYKYGMRAGGTVQFMIPLQGVSEFNDVSVKLNGDDEWQFSGISVEKIRTYDSRIATWNEISDGDLNSHLEYTRKVYTRNEPGKDIPFLVGKVYKEGEDRPEPDDDDWDPGTLVQDDGEYHSYNGIGLEVETREEIEWDKLRYYMTYEDTLRNLGFTKERCNYKVTVKVAGDLVNMDVQDEDCGSKNLFYFQLIFENGRSGCVLANQQIGGDAFRTGAQVTFDIPATQDYGELSSIQIIPDDQDSNSDIYDKLKIEWISVEKETTDALSPTWVAEGAAGEGLGWVGIEYRDPGEISSNRGAKGRSVSELATVYQITRSSYSAKFLVSITTAPYDTYPIIDDNGNTTTVTDSVMVGGVTMTIDYFDTVGGAQQKRNIDVIDSLNKYSGRKGSKVRRVEVDSEQKDVEYYVSDPNYNFRPGTTDSFFVSIDDISKFIGATLLIKGDKATNWNISSVKIYLVNGNGVRFINKDGEYDYKYVAGQGLKLVAKWDRQEPLGRNIEVYRELEASSIADVDFGFVEETAIDLNPDAAKWSSIIPVEPESKNDTLNLFLYPAEGGDSADPDSYTLSAAVRYVDGLTREPAQVSANPLRRVRDDDGNVVLYALGLGANNMDSFSAVDVETNSLDLINAPIRYGTLQRIRGGVLVETYHLGGTGNADRGASLKAIKDPDVRSLQHVMLQLSPDTKGQTLEKGAKDMAVALYFKTEDPGDMELRSKYVFLTDAGITSVGGGQVIELDMNLGNVREITGINLVTLGRLDVTVDAVSVEDAGADGAIYNTLSVIRPIKPGTRVTRAQNSGEARLLTLAFETGADESAVIGGTKAPIKMTIAYYDVYGQLRKRTYSDIRTYISSGSGFSSGGTDVVKIIVPEISELRWIELEPVSDGTNTLASWKLASVTASLGLDGRSITRSVDKLIVQGSPLSVGLADVLVSGKVTVQGDPTEAVTVNSGQSVSRLLDSGEQLNVACQIFGSSGDIIASVEAYDPTTGATSKVKLGTTYTYTGEYLKSIYNSASASAAGGLSADEKSAAKRVMTTIETMLNSAGSFVQVEDSFKFKAPRNYTGRDLHYLITVCSGELPDIRFTIDVTVYPETDVLPDAIGIWKTEQSNAAMQAGLQDIANEAASSASSGSSSSGSGSSSSESSGPVVSGESSESSQGGGSQPPQEGESGSSESGDQSSGSESSGSESSGSESSGSASDSSSDSGSSDTPESGSSSESSEPPAPTE